MEKKTVLNCSNDVAYFMLYFGNSLAIRYVQTWLNMLCESWTAVAVKTQSSSASSTCTCTVYRSVTLSFQAQKHIFSTNFFHHRLRVSSGLHALTLLELVLLLNGFFVIVPVFVCWLHVIKITYLLTYLLTCGKLSRFRISFFSARRYA